MTYRSMAQASMGSTGPPKKRGPVGRTIKWTAGIICAALVGLFALGLAVGPFSERITQRAGEKAAQQAAYEAEVSAREAKRLAAEKAAAERAAKVAAEQTEREAIAVCRNDWQKCADNGQLVSNYNGLFTAKYDCAAAANKMATYGTPTWPSDALSHFYIGDSYVTSGVVTVLEPDVQFSNGFGAMVRFEVTCSYDLRSKTITNVRISQSR